VPELSSARLTDDLQDVSHDRHLRVNFFPRVIPVGENGGGDPAMVAHISKTNWEGTGVTPDVRVPAADALATAQRMIAERARP
jgi:hypothetical protein